jgi:hypothetical protein
MKTSEILRLAKEQLWTGVGRPCLKPKFICHAINRTLGKGTSGEDIFHAKRIVCDLIHPCITLEDWLLRKKHVKHSDLYSGTKSRNRARLQATRHAWLDHLIQHHESLGD